ncbi:MAG: hypothetical protein J6U60_03285 [Clostridia bacterium]|nr:hypothetical protein [Clostridia bacterium]
MFDFIADLDAYFCEKYANYDKICILPGYRMPKMQTSEVREDGRTYAYTLPADTMRLGGQENKAELLQTLKSRMTDKTFSFSFRPVSIFSRIKNAFSKYAPHKWLKRVLEKNAVSVEDAGEALAIAPEIWQGIVKGQYIPTKNTLFSLALTSHIGIDDTKALLAVCGYEWDFAVEKDVVVCYLLEQKVFNRPMIDAALAEYKVSNLFLK